VSVAKEDGEARFEASDVVIATGAEPIVPPGFPFDGRVVMTSEEAVALPRVPAHMLVVGGGVVGLELATVYRRLGADVTVVELAPAILAGVDDELVRGLERVLADERITVRTGARVDDVAISGEHAEVRIAGVMETYDAVLVAIGRRPITRGLGLERAGVAIDARGYVVVDERRKTNVPGLWAVGDAAGGPLLAHKAMREGVVVAEALAGDRGSAYDPRAIPACVYTDPQIATVGMTEREARDAYGEVRVGRFPLSASGRARTMGVSRGLVKLVADARTDLLVGMHVLAPQAEALIGEGVMALEMNATLEDIALSMHPHPTLTEAIHDAAEASHGRAVHLVNVTRRGAR